MKLRIDPAAEEEAQEAALWYEDRRSGLGLEFLAAVDAAMLRIATTRSLLLSLKPCPKHKASGASS